MLLTRSVAPEMVTMQPCFRASCRPASRACSGAAVLSVPLLPVLQGGGFRVWDQVPPRGRQPTRNRVDALRL